jgi:putative tryptophan/tyrosine transport system substrate-binding protein
MTDGRPHQATIRGCRRRSFVHAAALAALPSARAQNAPHRVGVLSMGDTPRDMPRLLAELSRAEGREIAVEMRSAAGRIDAMPRLAAELIALKPAVIISLGPQATQAVLAADPVVQVVALLGAAVETGMAPQLARPGGRLTGVSFLGSTLNAKRLELLAEALPKGAAVLNLGDPGARTPFVVEDLARFSRAAGLSTHNAYADTPAEIDAAFATAKRLRVGGINVLASPFLHAHRARIIEQAAKARLAAIYQWPQSAREGGLMAYGPDLQAMNRLLAERAVRVLGGTPAGELPIVQPTRFELVVNQSTARAIGLALPQTLLLRADEVVA